jgi:hypothetical protein
VDEDIAHTPLVSPVTRLVASEAKATKRPSALIAGSRLSPLPWTLPLETLTRVVVPAWRSRTNTSNAPLVSPPTRSVAFEAKAMNRPSPLIAGRPPPVLPSEGTPALVMLTTSVVPAADATG